MFYSAYQWNAYQWNAYQIARESQTVQTSGGWASIIGEKRRTKEDIRKAREEYGLAFEVIETVALRQSKQLLTDKQKIFDELDGELKLNGLEFEARYLKSLNDRREELVSADLSKLLRLRIQQEEEDVLMMLTTMVANKMI